MLPFGKAAQAISTVNSGISPIGSAFSDMAFPPGELIVQYTSQDRTSLLSAFANSIRKVRENHISGSTSGSYPKPHILFSSDSTIPRISVEIFDHFPRHAFHELWSIF
jgi:hypothetical protein